MSSVAWWHLLRNLAASLLLTKAATEPLVKIFAKQSTRSPEDLLGLECEISTHEATPDEGQARFRIEDGAPLLLNVRTEGETLRLGDAAKIVGYEPTTRIYFVEAPKNKA